MTLTDRLPGGLKITGPTSDGDAVFDAFQKWASEQACPCTPYQEEARRIAHRANVNPPIRPPGRQEPGSRRRALRASLPTAAHLLHTVAGARRWSARISLRHVRDLRGAQRRHADRRRQRPPLGRPDPVRHLPRSWQPGPARVRRRRRRPGRDVLFHFAQPDPRLGPGRCPIMNCRRPVRADVGHAVDTTRFSSTTSSAVTGRPPRWSGKRVERRCRCLLVLMTPPSRRRSRAALPHQPPIYIVTLHPARRAGNGRSPDEHHNGDPGAEKDAIATAIGGFRFPAGFAAPYPAVGTHSACHHAGMLPK